MRGALVVEHFSRTNIKIAEKTAFASIHISKTGRKSAKFFVYSANTPLPRNQTTSSLSLLPKVLEFGKVSTDLKYASEVPKWLFEKMSPPQLFS